MILVWVAAYTSLRPWPGAGTAALEALLIAAIWQLIHVRVAQAFRSMTFAVGPYAVAAHAAFGTVVAVGAVDFWFDAFGIDRKALAVIGLAGFVAAGTWDYVVGRVAHTPLRVLIVGGGSATSRFLADLEREPGATLEVLAVVDDTVEDAITARVPYGGPLSGLPATVRRLSPDLVVVAVSTGRPEVFGQLLGVADAGFQFVGLPEVYEFTFGRLPVEDLTSAWFMSILHAYHHPVNRFAKRCFDIVMSLVGLGATFLLLPFVLVLQGRTKGPVLYRQRRLGEHGQVFTIMKFRSMRVDAEASGDAQWASKDDPRIIPGGRMLRLLRLDELPQFWNVLRGEMSIVGPRPERPEFIGQLEAEVPFWTHRHLLKPGITGWAQIRAGYAADALGTVEKLSYDLWYLRHRSVALDVMICLKTVPRMLLLRGAR